MREDATVYAVKIFEEEYKELGFKEYEILKHLEGHPNIIRVLSYESNESVSQKELKDQGHDEEEIQ